jgi:hypothetical protein
MRHIGGARDLAKEMGGMLHNMPSHLRTISPTLFTLGKRNANEHNELA